MVWPLFAAHGCERTPKAALVDKGVLRKASNALEMELEAETKSSSGLGIPARRGIISEYSRPGSSYVVSREFPSRPGSAQPKSLSATSRPSTGSGGYQSGRPPTTWKGGQAIDILAEEDPKDNVANVSKGLKSLGI